LRIDLARDPAWRLELLPGVGPARAHAIVRARAARGPPARLEDLAAIPGLGPARLDAIRRARDVVVTLAGTPVAGPGVDAPGADPPR
jgi:competence protein ComEA